MSEGAGTTDVHRLLMELAFDPELLRLGAALRALVDYDIPSERRAPFLRFHAFVTDSQPTYISAWRADERMERKWYHGHVGGILDNVRNGLAAAGYHLQQLAELENATTELLASSDFAARMGKATAGLGGTRRLDFEYQAFVLACRRSLDYLAVALASYFKAESNNFRKLPNSLASKRPAPVANALVAAHARHADKLSFIMAEGRQSTRNRIAHYEFVSAGVINLTARGFTLVGGGEELMPSRDQTEARLQDVLSRRLDELHDCVADMIDSFIAAAKDVDSAA